MLGIPETKQVPRTLDATQVLRTTEATLAPRMLKVVQSTKLHWKHLLDLKILITRTLDHLGQKIREETETKI